MKLQKLKHEPRQILVKVFIVCSILPSIFLIVLYEGYLIYKSSELGHHFLFGSSMSIGIYSLILGSILFIAFKVMGMQLPTVFTKLFFILLSFWLIIFTIDPFGILNFVMN